MKFLLGLVKFSKEFYQGWLNLFIKFLPGLVENRKDFYQGW
jgi:hypothetical protein